jgi:class 3 adenylate cyclase
MSRLTLRMRARDGSSELAPRARVRKTVSIVFADVVGSTALAEGSSEVVVFRA